MPPLVSIIIPTYNRAHLIAETLDSVVAQTYTNWECIIVDDGSTDHTDEVVEEYVQKDSRFKYFHRPDEHLPGGNGARNYGFKMSKGEYIQWFDSDDLMLPEKLGLKVKAMVGKEVDIVFCNSIFISTENFLFEPLNISENNLFLDLLKNHIKIATISIFFKKSFLEHNILIWNELLMAGQEWEFIIRCFYYNNNFKFLDLLYDKIRDDNISLTRSENKSFRFENYLKSRIFILKFLKTKSFYDFNRYYKFIYKDSLKYIKYLISEKKFAAINEFSSITYEYSRKDYYYFNLGIFFYRFFDSSFIFNKLK